jgi:hypothetical protein
VRGERIGFDDTPGAPWIILPPDARRAFDLLRSRGDPLSTSAIGRPYLGVKCGYNDAFVVHAARADTPLVAVSARNGRTGVIERALLRPLVRGEAVSAWALASSDESIIWTHDSSDAPLASLPPHAARWFAGWRRHLIARTDARRAARWWALFRTEGARNGRPRVVWADVGRRPRAAILFAGDESVALNSCYIARCRDDRDAFALAALLNGPVAGAWLNALAEPARGGYRRYLGWTMALLPLPIDWTRARDALAPLGEAAVRTRRAPSDADLLDASLAAYDLRRRDVAPLVAWAAL